MAAGTTLAWGTSFAILLLTLRHDIVALYTTERDVLQLAAGLLLLGAMFQVFDCSQATLMGALRGYKDTRAPMVIAVIAYWVVGLPLGASLCFGGAGDRGHRRPRYLVGTRRRSGRRGDHVVRPTRADLQRPGAGSSAATALTV